MVYNLTTWNSKEYRVHGQQRAWQSRSRYFRRCVEWRHSNFIGNRSLGVALDRKLSFDYNVNNTCRLCYHHIRALWHILESLPDELSRPSLTVSLVSASITVTLFSFECQNWISDKLQNSPIEHVGARRIASCKVWTHYASFERASATGSISFKSSSLVNPIKNAGHWVTNLSSSTSAGRVHAYRFALFDRRHKTWFAKVLLKLYSQL